MKPTRVFYFETLLLLLTASFALADEPNAIFWERSFTMNLTTTTAANTGTTDFSTSTMVTSQDFQGLQVDDKSKRPPDRFVFNFGQSCRSSNTTIESLQALNLNGMNVSSIRDAQKVALVQRGNCNWSEKLAVVKSFSNYINVTAMFIYDNDTFGNVPALVNTAVYGSNSVSLPSFNASLPPSRNIDAMPDNDLKSMLPLSTVVYYLPAIYGNLLVQRINTSVDPNNPSVRRYWLLSPYLEQVSWGSPGGESFFGSSRGYLSYIIALAAIFVIGIIFLRWWRIRRLRRDHPNGFNGFSMANGFNMQPRVHQADPLPVDIVNSLPIDKYSEELIKNTNCAVCLEDFMPGKDDIRILPCGHGFCVLCIDPWLTQKSCMCPICKWDCLPPQIRQERNALLQQQQQQQQQNQQHQQPFTNTPNQFVVNMPNHTEALANNNPPASTGIYVPPTLLHSSSPPPPPPPSSTGETEKQIRPKNPFEEPSNRSPSGESSNPLSPPPFTEVDMSSEKKISDKKA